MEGELKAHKISRHVILMTVELKTIENTNSVGLKLI